MHILKLENWDPQTLHAPNPELVPPMETLADDIPYAVGRQLILDVPVYPKGVVDVYIDDTVGLTVDQPGSNNYT